MKAPQSISKNEYDTTTLVPMINNILFLLYIVCFNVWKIGYEKKCPIVAAMVMPSTIKKAFPIAGFHWRSSLMR